MAGLTLTGYENQDLDTILAGLEAEEKANLGQDLNVRPTSVMGVINGVLATKLSELWDVGNEVWASQYPDTAVGVSLDQVCQITGVLRLDAQQSSVVLALSGVNGTPIPALRRVKHVATGTFWTNPASATIGAGATTSVDFVSEDYGPVEALAGTLTVIDTAVSGWVSVTNPLDATLGRDREADAEFRARRASLLVAAGNATVDAIRAAMLKLDGVVAANVLENVTSSTDGDGLPAHSFECILDITTAAASTVGQAVWSNKPAGISAYGSATAPAVDAVGNAHVMAYTPCTPRNVYVSLTASTGAGYSGATADFASSLAVFGTSLGMSADVFYNAALNACFVPGVANVTDMRMGFSSNPSGTSTLSVGTRERAKFDSTRIVVTIV